jgi:TPR repeat protein
MAAGQGNPSAQCQLARMHMTGAGVSKDDLEAYQWASLAAKQGDREAKVVIGYLERKMTPEQLTILQKRSRDSIDSRDLDKAIPLPTDVPENLPTELPVDRE